jgi:hypothetical protein
MRKHYSWGVQKAQGRIMVMRFRSDSERASWIQNGADWVSSGMPPICRIAVLSTDSEVRRINNQIKAGEDVKFPVVIEEG